MLALLVTLSSFAQDIDVATVEVGDLRFELPDLEPPDDLGLGFEVYDDGSVEVRAGRIDPYRTFKFTVSVGGDAAEDVYDLCLEGRCPEALVTVGDEVWLYVPDSSSASPTSDPEWKYTPVRRLGL